MTLYYSLVFALLVAEMALFTLLILPMPLGIKRKILIFISESPLIAQLQHSLKITFIFILILFIDSVNRVYRVQVELHQAREQGGQAAAAAVAGHDRSEVQARRFYSQRNMYLCGFTLFLSLILNRTYVLILDIMRLEEKVRRYEGDPKGSDKDSGKLDRAGESGEIGRLKLELGKRDKNIEALKKQMEGLQREYNNLGDQSAGTAADGTPKKSK